MSERTLRGHQRITLLLLFVAGTVNFLDRASLSIASTTIQKELHLDGTQLGALLTAFSLAYGLAQLPLIGLIDRLGTRWMLGGGLALWSAAQLVTGFARSLPTLLGLRVVLGAGEAPFYPSGVRSVREWFPPATRGRATAVMNMSQTLGLAAAPPILTGLMLWMGWRRTFMALGAVGLLLSILWMFLQRSRASTIFAEPQFGTIRPGHGAWKALLSRRTVWGMMLGFGGINYTSWLYISWLPAYLQTGRHVSLAKTGWLAALPFVCAGIGMLLSGMVVDRWVAKGAEVTTVHRVNLVAGMVLSALCTSCVSHIDGTYGAVAAVSGALFCIHFAGNSALGYVQAVSPPGYVASLASLENFASFMIASCAPILTGWLLDRTHSFTAALALCSVVTLLGALSYATLAAPDGQ